jgi:hypothetical protein
MTTLAVRETGAPPDLGRAPLIALAGALTIAFSAILVHQADVHPATAAGYRCAYAIPLLGLLAWRERRRYGPRGAGQQRLALIAGLFFAADLIFWHQAIADRAAGRGAERAPVTRRGLHPRRAGLDRDARAVTRLAGRRVRPARW